jgi:secreted trypsin-like serine protease
VIAGLLKRSDMTDTVTVNVARYVMHGEYNSPDASFANDIALIYFTDPIAANGGTIQYARLPSNDLQNFAGDGCIISGWGRDSNANILPDTLQFAAIPVLTVPACRVQFAAVAASVWDKQICVFDDANNVGSCNGDSGGPLNCDAVGGTVVAGITSWVMSGPLGNCLQTFPSVYTRTSSYLAWIADN